MALSRTLGEIRADIQTRLGFGMSGQAGVVNSPLIDSMINSAQRQLYQQFDWLQMRGVEERLTGADQQFYDYPADCDIEQINGIWIKWGGRFYPLTEGIAFSDRGFTVGGPPQKYERRAQYELWPVPSTNGYTIRIEYIRTLALLVNSSDRTSLPSEIVYLHALANAKMHYRQPDAATYSTQLDMLLERLKAKHRGQSVWGQVKTPDPYAPGTLEPWSA